jgi:hypothetical protein
MKMNKISSSKLGKALAFSCALLLAACGGGGGDATVVKQGVALYTSAGATVTIGAGVTATYNIGGGGNASGTTTYSAATNNAAVATASVKGNTLTIVGGSAGSATISVSDSTGNGVVVLIGVTISSGGSTTALYTTAQTAITITGSASPTYMVAGGTPPYNTSSSNTAVATSSITGNTLTIKGIASGSTNVAVFDSVGAAASVIAVSVSNGAIAGLYTTAPSPLKIGAGSASSIYTIAGGRAPYTVSTDNSGTATATVTGTDLSITGVSSGNANIIVFDSTGATSTIAVVVGTLGTPTPLYTTAQGAITVATGSNTGFTVAGGQGPYVQSSSNASVATASITGSALSISGVGPGTAVISILDAAQTKLTVTVTVGSATMLYTTSPSAVTIAAGAAPTYVIRGGVTPYVATSSSESNMRVSVSGSNMTITGISATGIVPPNVVVVDSAGSTVSIAVTVP